MELEQVLPIIGYTGTALLTGLRLSEVKWVRFARQGEALERLIESARARQDPIQHAVRAVYFERLMRLHPRGKIGYYRMQCWLCLGLLGCFIAFPFVSSKPEVARDLAAVGILIVTFLWGLCYTNLVSAIQTNDTALADRYYACYLDARKAFMKDTENVDPIPPMPSMSAAMRPDFLKSHVKEKHVAKAQDD